CPRQRTVSAIRQKFPLLISHANFRDLKTRWFQQLSAPIVRFCGDLRQNPRIAFIEKRPSALAATINRMKFRPVRLGCDHWVRASSLTATCNNGGAAWRWRIESGGGPRLPSCKGSCLGLT